MIRFLVLTGFLAVVFGALIHFHAEPAWFPDWIGKLPGDLVVKKGEIVIYLPFATAGLASLVLSAVASLIVGNRN